MYARLEQKSIKIDLINHLLSIAICFWRRFRKKRFLALAGLIESMLGYILCMKNNFLLDILHARSGYELSNISNINLILTYDS